MNSDAPKTDLRRPPTVWEQTRGVVYVEYLIAVMPIFTMFLCMVQLALMMEAGIMVHHAANRAARSAMVVIREPQDYVAKDNGNLFGTNLYANASSLSDDRRPTLQFMKGLEYGGGFIGIGGGGGASGFTNSASGTARLFTVRAAAQMKLTAVAPHMSDLHATRGGSSVKFAMGNGQSLDDAASAGNYARHAVGLSAPGLDGWGGGQTTINVGVSYVFPCMVPLAQTIICHGEGAGFATEAGEGTVTGAMGGFTRTISHTVSVPIAPQIYMPGERH